MAVQPDLQYIRSKTRRYGFLCHCSYFVMYSMKKQTFDIFFRKWQKLSNNFNQAINPYSTNGFSHHYQLGESTFICRCVRSDFYFFSHFSMKFLCANRIAPNGTPRSAASERGVTSGAMLFAYVPQKGHQT